MSPCNVWFMPQTTISSRRREPRMDLIGLRINEGLSREDMAYRLGIGRETIRLAEAGFVPTPRVQFKIAQAFGRRPLDLWPMESQRRPARRKPVRRTAVAA